MVMHPRGSHLLHGTEPTENGDARETDTGWPISLEVRFRWIKRLGFDSFIEAFNVIGYAMRSKPASIKNYRDEFDPLFPNRRKGWHKRKTRDYCLKVFEEYKNLDLESFTGL